MNIIKRQFNDINEEFGKIKDELINMEIIEIWYPVTIVGQITTNEKWDDKTIDEIKKMNKYIFKKLVNNVKIYCLCIK